MSLQLETPAGELMTLNMGPHHPSTHGVLRLIVTTDGEVVTKAVPDLGYLHRSIEKIGEYVEWYQFVCYTDRVDYVCSMNSNHAYVMAAEALFNTDPTNVVKIPERAEHIRVLFAELNRISSHMIALGAMAMDLGAYTPFLHGIAQREFVNDIFEKTCGARLTYNYYTIGGVMFDLLPGTEEEVTRFLVALETAMVDFNKIITTNRIFRNRLGGVGVISREDAISYGLVGPNLRGSGVDWDLRRDVPYGMYEKLQFDIPIGQRFAGKDGELGDSYDRYVVRTLEVLESIKICRQVLKTLPPPHAKDKADAVGGYQANVNKQLKKPPKGEIYFRCENPRGETGYYIVSDGTKNPYRIKIRTGSFTAMSIFEKLSRGVMIADLVAIIGSLDIVVPEIDR